MSWERLLTSSALRSFYHHFACILTFSIIDAFLGGHPYSDKKHAKHYFYVFGFICSLLMSDLLALIGCSRLHVMIKDSIYS
jgi:hypothetical protein